MKHQKKRVLSSISWLEVSPLLFPRLLSLQLKESNFCFKLKMLTQKSNLVKSQDIPVLLTVSQESWKKKVSELSTEVTWPMLLDISLHKLLTLPLKILTKNIYVHTTQKPKKSHFSSETLPLEELLVPPHYVSSIL